MSQQEQAALEASNKIAEVRSAAPSTSFEVPQQKKKKGDCKDIAALVKELKVPAEVEAEIEGAIPSEDEEDEQPLKRKRTGKSPAVLQIGRKPKPQPKKAKSVIVPPIIIPEAIPLKPQGKEPSKKSSSTRISIKMSGSSVDRPTVVESPASVTATATVSVPGPSSLKPNISRTEALKTKLLAFDSDTESDEEGSTESSSNSEPEAGDSANDVELHLNTMAAMKTKGIEVLGDPDEAESMKTSLEALLAVKDVNKVPESARTTIARVVKELPNLTKLYKEAAPARASYEKSLETKRKLDDEFGSLRSNAKKTSDKLAPHTTKMDDLKAKIEALQGELKEEEELAAPLEKKLDEFISQGTDLKERRTQLKKTLANAEKRYSEAVKHLLDIRSVMGDLFSHFG